MPDRAHTTVGATARVRRGISALASAGATLVLLVTGTTAALAQPSAGAGGTLKCSLRTAPGGRITFSPAVSSTPRRISAHGTVDLDDCTSPDGRQSRIKSGRLVLSGSGLATCSGATGVQGTGTVTWYSGGNRTGRVIGRTTVRPASGGGQGYTPVDSFLSGEAASGLMAGHTFSGTAVPTNDVKRCFTAGLGYLEGRGSLTVG
ncbi:hypothetical protein ACH427_28195 [Streptomyces sp. NPDC020379]|uniref:hypothetical protein n=1 Tax=Streptomyces sp. NPDC020379 TaxID=3365071 RepID=UPI003795BAE5